MIPLRYFPEDVEEEYYQYVTREFSSQRKVEDWNSRAKFFLLGSQKKRSLKSEIRRLRNKKLRYWLEEKLEGILIGRPDKLRELGKEFTSKFSKAQGLNSLKKLFIDWYKYLAERRKDFSYSLLKVIGVSTCPYCNREYIQLISSSKGGVRPHFDHFFPKSKYFIFSVSLYNLIPCCYFCNISKGEKFCKDLKGPYEIGDKDFVFSYDIELDDKEMGVLAINLKAIERGIKGIKIFTEYKKNVRYFRLIEAYMHHKDVVAEVILKSRLYPKEYFKMLDSVLEGLSLLGSISEKDWYRLFFSAYDRENFHRRPLSKLISDIYEEINSG